MDAMPELPWPNLQRQVVDHDIVQAYEWAEHEQHVAATGAAIPGVGRCPPGYGDLRDTAANGGISRVTTYTKTLCRRPFRPSDRTLRGRRRRRAGALRELPDDCSLAGAAAAMDTALADDAKGVEGLPAHRWLNLSGRRQRR